MLAYDFLKKQNHKILYHRYQSYLVEIDLLSFKSDEQILFFNEVKSSEFSMYNYSSSHKKRLLSLANAFIEEGFPCICQILVKNKKDFSIHVIDA